jgi:hypothetical protein
MNIKIWIGNDELLRKHVLSLFDVNKYGGLDYFEGTACVYVYSEGRDFDIRVGAANKDSFDAHPNTEIKIMIC